MILVHKGTYPHGPRFWLRKTPPSYSNVWLFKTNHLSGLGVFESRQRNPSGVTVRVIVDGRWLVRMAGVEAAARRGDLFLALPGEPIDFFQTDASSGWEWFELQFNGTAAERFVEEFGLSRLRPVATPRHPLKARKLFEALHDLMGRRDRAESRVMELLFQLINACGAAGASAGEVRRGSAGDLVRRATTLLETDSSPSMNVTQMAQRLGVDRATLGRAFKRETGDGPHQFIESYRMMRVRELLDTTALPVRAIANASGFADVKYFINWFRGKNKIPPGAWRRRGQRCASE